MFILRNKQNVCKVLRGVQTYSFLFCCADQHAQIGFYAYMKLCAKRNIFMGDHAFCKPTPFLFRELTVGTDCTPIKAYLVNAGIDFMKIGFCLFVKGQGLACNAFSAEKKSSCSLFLLLFPFA